MKIFLISVIVLAVVGIACSNPSSYDIAPKPDATDAPELFKVGSQSWPSEDAYRAEVARSIKTDGSAICQTSNENASVVIAFGTADERRALHIRNDECNKAGY